MNVNKKLRVDCQKVCSNKTVCNTSVPSSGGRDREEALVSSGLKNLASKVPKVLLSSHANSTNKSCHRIFCLWKKWAEKFEVKKLPAEEYFVSLFLIDLGTSTESSANCRHALPAMT